MDTTPAALDIDAMDRAQLVAEVHRLRMEAVGYDRALKEASRVTRDSEQVWRVMRSGRDDSDAVDLTVLGEPGPLSTWLLSYGDGWDKVQARCAREAVAAWVVQTGFGPTVAEILAPGEPSRAELTRERDAALAAVDAVRADYAPRREPPTAEEVRALARLWPHHDGAAVVLLRVLSRTGDRVAPHAVSVIVENDGTVEGFAANDMDKLHRADGWRAECPDGPVAWSHLAAMVARGGDRG